MHPAHRLTLGGAFSPLTFPPTDLAPKAIARAIDAYNELKAEREEAVAKVKSLADKTLDREAEEADAIAIADGEPPNNRARLAEEREATRLAKRGLEIKLDRALEALISEPDHAWEQWLAATSKAYAKAQQKAAQARAEIEQQAHCMGVLDALATWLEGFPIRTKWSGEVNSIPPEQRTALSTLALYELGQISADQIGIRRERPDPLANYQTLGRHSEKGAPTLTTADLTGAVFNAPEPAE